MQSLQKQFQQFVKHQQLLHRKDKLLLAVSGGVDSMVLADIVYKCGYTFQVAHVNYRLRGLDSDSDEALVKNRCQQLGIRLHLKHFEPSRKSLQTEARNARYKWFNELLIQEGLDKIVLGQHLNDSLETALINLVRGTGLKGFIGIQPLFGNRVRPLLFATKENLVEYAQENNLEWREDQSNQENKYDRNKLRNEVIPILKQLNPSIVRTFRNTSERAALSFESISRAKQAVLDEHLSKDVQTDRINTSWIKHRSDLIILAEILADYAFNYVTVKEIFEARGTSGKTFSSERHRLIIDRDRFIIYKDKTSTPIRLTISALGIYPMEKGQLKVEIVNAVKDFETQSAYLDMAKIQFPLEVSTWEQGDYFQPLGMKGKKKVSDYLIDRKVSVFDKKKVLKVTLHNEIIWLVGFQISERYKVSSNSRHILKLSVQNPNLKVIKHL